ncbi:hypothetical protein HERIO_525 [Hepatospora eriocheir]|uniref:TOM40 n=1 Tax=Hepatospora eriocheir TaxID=1081669 RepID=A0A1X0QD65_9MICR|nr:hypothetical protein HERIO_525 [Hepatospora eriocheir]
MKNDLRNFIKNISKGSYNNYLNYDLYNNEFISISSPNLNLGNKLEITKTLTKNIQLTSIMTKFNKQYFLTLFKDFHGLSFINSTVFQASHELNGVSQLKCSVQMFKNLLNVKYDTIVNKNKEVFSQLENFITTQNNAFCLKLIKHSFESSNLIYIFNYWKNFGFACAGAEVVGFNNNLSFNFCGRVSDDYNVIGVSVEKFNIFTTSFYRKLYKNIEMGVEYTENRDTKRKTGIIACRMKNMRSEFKFTVNNLLEYCFSWDEYLTSNLVVGLSGTYCNNTLNYGFHFTYDI